MVSRHYGSRLFFSRCLFLFVLFVRLSPVYQHKLQYKHLQARARGLFSFPQEVRNNPKAILNMMVQHLDGSPCLVVAAAPSSSSEPLSTPVLPSRVGLSSGAPCYSELIDNSTLQYSSVRLKCGVTVQVGENVLEGCPGILDDLNQDLIGCLSVLPASTWRLVRRTQIWVNRT